MRFNHPMDMRSRLLRAIVLVSANAILIGGCGVGETRVSSTGRPNWPQTPGRSAEETRAIREAELAIYRDPKYDRRADPAPAPSVEKAPVQLSGDYVTSSRYGDLLFVSAQLPVDPQGIPLPPATDVETQARRALDNVRTVLEANRLTMSNVVSMTIYLTDLADLEAFDVAANGYFKSTRPSRTVLEVNRLPYNAALQVSAVAGR